ncbi:MAG: S-methyl-5-thioribose kinase [Treponema sp.]|jgi:5-methylthioribose kinase|nr:S-methyl-5-thioribose kinase [Treponema sp.]
MDRNNYGSYFLMDTKDIPGYIKSKAGFFGNDEALTVEEIGDGDVNYIFRVRGAGKSLIIKQAGRVTRLDPTWKLSTDRGRIEAEYLAVQRKLTPGSVPEIYLYDPVMCAIIMEDLSDYTPLRKALLERRRVPAFADLFSTYLVNALIFTSDVAADHLQKKEMVKQFTSPQMCDIFEKLRNTEPFIDMYNRNRILPENLDFVRREFYEDKGLHLEAAKLKFEFMNKPQALIHSDLHTGSVFVREDSIKVFDSEFAFFGPMGVDPGNFTAHLFFAWANADAEPEQTADILDFKQWLLDMVEEFFALFTAKFKAVFNANAADALAKTPGFCEWYLNNLLVEAAGVCGLEMARRTIGLSHIEDLAGIADEKRRARVERIVLRLAKLLILNRYRVVNGAGYTLLLRQAVDDEKKNNQVRP